MVIDIFKKYADLRMNILPYIYQQAMQTCETGIPLMRNMYMEYPSDSCCSEISGQYMFGDSLLVAPVFEEHADCREVYLPEGIWTDLFSGRELKGGKYIKAAAGIDRIPVYVKENSIIPLNLSENCGLFDHVGNETEKIGCLCFLACLYGRVKYDFTDGSGMDIHIGMARIEGKICISMTSACDITVAFILKNIPKSGEKKTEVCSMSESGGTCGKSCYSHAIRGDDLVLKCRCQSKGTMYLTVNCPC